MYTSFDLTKTQFYLSKTFAIFEDLTTNRLISEEFCKLEQHHNVDFSRASSNLCTF